MHSHPGPEVTRSTGLTADAPDGELLIWRAAVARARSALSKTFEGRMEAALASFEVVPENGRGAGGHTLADFAAEVGIGYASLDQYRQVMKWLGDFVYVYEISSYSLARQAQVSGRFSCGAEFSRFLADEPTPMGHPWTVGSLRLHLQHELADGGAPRRGRGGAKRMSDGADTDIEEPAEPRRARQVAAKAAQKVQGLIAKGVSTTYPEEEDVCWKKAAELIRAYGLTVEVSAGR